MPYQAVVYRVLIASPGDLTEDRATVRDAFQEWNALHAEEGIAFEPVMYEKDAVPELGDRAQEIINRQLLSKSDLLFGMFWTKLGAPTGVAISGTVEEIERFVKAGKPAAIYICDKSVPISMVDAKQLAALQEFKEALFKQGLIGKYSTTEQLRDEFKKFLTRAKQQLSNAGKQEDKSGPLTVDHSKIPHLTMSLSGHNINLAAVWIHLDRESINDVSFGTVNNGEDVFCRDLATLSAGDRGGFTVDYSTHTVEKIFVEFRTIHRHYFRVEYDFHRIQVEDNRIPISIDNRAMFLRKADKWVPVLDDVS